jgi:hypothetical protein
LSFFVSGGKNIHLAPVMPLLGTINNFYSPGKQRRQEFFMFHCGPGKLTAKGLIEVMLSNGASPMQYDSSAIAGNQNLTCIVFLFK